MGMLLYIDSSSQSSVCTEKCGVRYFGGNTKHSICDPHDDMGLCVPQSYIIVTIWIFSVWNLAFGSPSFQK
jgi:hypothetical protein